MTHLLIVDDEPHFRNTLIRALKSQGHRATAIEDCDALTSTLVVHRPDVVLLDLTFDSGVSGLEACQRLRTWSSVPVIIVSASDDEPTKVKALDSGADDYLAKPFGIDELMARVRAVQRRLAAQANAETPLIRVNDLTIDLDRRLISLRGEALHLTRKEYKLLRTLALSLGRLVTYEKIMEEVWGIDAEVERASVRTLVKQVRHKLGEDLSNPTYVITEAGMGYRLNMNATPA